MAYILTRN